MMNAKSVFVHVIDMKIKVLASVFIAVPYDIGELAHFFILIAVALGIEKQYLHRKSRLGILRFALLRMELDHAVWQALPDKERLTVSVRPGNILLLK